MFQSPENRGQGEPSKDFDLDFTKPGAIEVKEDFTQPEDKIISLNKGIEVARKGIRLARSVNDAEMEAKMEAKIAENQATIAMLENSIKAKDQPKQEVWVEPAHDPYGSDPQDKASKNAFKWRDEHPGEKLI
jgi:hypothetical protein